MVGSKERPKSGGGGGRGRVVVAGIYLPFRHLFLPQTPAVPPSQAADRRPPTRAPLQQTKEQ
jgi:hypothetical protein